MGIFSLSHVTGHEKTRWRFWSICLKTVSQKMYSICIRGFLALFCWDGDLINVFYWFCWLGTTRLLISASSLVGMTDLNHCTQLLCWDEASGTIWSDWPLVIILAISASQETRITDVNLWHLDPSFC
jgi:hypothetical protein